MLWACRGIPQTNAAAPLIIEYNAKRALAKLGYRFSAEDLMDWEVEAMVLISSEIAKQEADMTKRSHRKGKPRG